VGYTIGGKRPSAPSPVDWLSPWEGKFPAVQELSRYSSSDMQEANAAIGNDVPRIIDGRKDLERQGVPPRLCRNNR
jgi:hypothetical protein